MKSYRDKRSLGILGLSVFAAVGVSMLGGKAVSALDIQPGIDSYTLPGDSSEQIVVKPGANVTINLNGHNLTTDKKDSIIVDNGATATIKGEGTVEATGTDVSPIYNNGTLTIDGGTYLKDESKGTYYAILNHGDLTFNGGTVKMVNYSKSSLVDNGYYDYANRDAGERQAYIDGVNSPAPSLTIKDGTFVGGGNVVKNDGGGLLTIDGGDFKRDGSEPGHYVVMNYNEATINGGTFATAGDGGPNDTVLFNNIGYLSTDGSGKLTVNGGKFSGRNIFSTDTKYRNDPVTTEINGGTFNTEQVMRVGLKASEVGLSVKGGTFRAPVDVAPAEGYVTIENADDTKSVVTEAEAEKIAAERKADEEAKASEDKEVTKPREAQDAGKGSANEATIAAPNTGVEVASGLNLGAVASGITALVSAGLAVIAKIKL